MPSRQQNQPERVKLFWRAPKSRLPCAARPVPPDRGPPDIPKCLRSLTSKFGARVDGKPPASVYTGAAFGGAQTRAAQDRSTYYFNR